MFSEGHHIAVDEVCVVEIFWPPGSGDMKCFGEKGGGRLCDCLGETLLMGRVLKKASSYSAGEEGNGLTAETDFRCAMMIEY